MSCKKTILNKTTNFNDFLHKNNIPDNHIIVKYGYTSNLENRTSQHIKTYGTIKGVTLELLNYAYVDPKYLSQEEVDIKEYFETLQKHLI